MQKKISFWAIFALVTGSQIGSGVFMLPASLALYGSFSLVGWLIAGLGAVLLALVFASLCARFPRTGGPHVYIKEAFGPIAAFFTGWTYWIVSWVSTTVVIASSVGYLSPIIGQHSQSLDLALQIGLLLLITMINLKGVRAAGSAEFVLSLLKIVPLLVVPAIALLFFNKENFVIDNSVADHSTFQILGHVTLLTLWGFIGLESATTPAESVENPAKTIPRAIILGTGCVAFLYFINSVALMGLIPGNELMISKAPYADAAKVMFGGNLHLLISLIASIVCIGTLNAWTLTSGQIALGLAQDNLLPEIFAKKNKDDAPYFSLIISSTGIIILLVLSSNESLSKQINTIIDLSVLAFVFVYMVCCLALLKLIWRQKFKNKVQFIYTIFAFLFCLWVVFETPLQTILIASSFTISGLPIYLLRKQTKVAKG